MPKITIDVHLPYDDMPVYDVPEDEVIVVDEFITDEDPEEVTITCPTCGAVIEDKED